MKAKLLKMINNNGTTWLVMDETTGRICVRKIVGAEQLPIYESLKNNRIKGVPGVLEIETLKEHEYAVYEEYIRGISLENEIEKGSTFDEKRVAAIIATLAKILDKLHALNIIHRDIKPANVMQGADGNIYLIDFGIARNTKKDRIADTTYLGTEGFAAPEQFGFGQSDCRTDIYALGTLANFLLIGRNTTEEIYAGELGTFIKRCVEINPADRFQTATELLEALQSGIITEKARNGKIKSKHIIFAVIIVVALIAGVIAIIKHQLSGSSTDESTADSQSSEVLTEEPTEEPTELITESPTVAPQLLPEHVVSMGKCGDNATFTVYDDGKAVFSGTGDINIDAYGVFGRPWKDAMVIEIESGITEIGDSVFRNTNIIKIDIPNTVKRIGNQAFYSCACPSILMPDSVTEIGDDCFRQGNISTIYLSENLSKTGRNALCGLKISQLEIPGSLKVVEGSLFSGCENLETVRFNEGVTTLNDNALSGLNNLAKVYLPSTITHIGQQRYEWMNLSLEMYYPGSIQTLYKAYPTIIKDGSVQLWAYVNYGTDKEERINFTQF